RLTVQLTLAAPLFPYTTLFRSSRERARVDLHGLIPEKAQAPYLCGTLEQRDCGKEVDATRQVVTREEHFADDGAAVERVRRAARSEEHTSELQSPDHLVCRLLL